MNLTCKPCNLKYTKSKLVKNKPIYVGDGIYYPYNCPECNDLVCYDRHEKLKEIIDLDSIKSEMLELKHRGLEKGAPTGLNALDEYFTVRKKEWTVITGIPNSGKTEFLDNIILNLSALRNWKFGVFSAENLPHSRYATSLIEKNCNKHIDNIDQEEYESVFDYIKDHFWFINPDENQFTIDNILAISKELIEQHDIDVISIDPWNELDHSRPTGMTETEYISQCLTKVRRFARINDIHIFVIAHPTKLMKNRDGGYNVPTPYDISGSAHWRNKSDNAMAIWRDFTRPGTCEIHIQKIRFKEVGMIGKVDLNYNRETGRYS